MKGTSVEADFETDANSAVAESLWVVLKFGGSSVSSAKNWQTIANLLRNRLDAGLQPVVVHSALQGVSNRLESVLQLAINGDPSEQLAAIRDQHEELAAELGLDVKALLSDTLRDLDQLIAGIRLVREVSVRVRVRVMALGEIMVTRLGAEFLRGEGDWLEADPALNLSTGKRH